MRARDNPFATAHVHRIRYQFDGLTWDQFLHRLAQAQYRGAIVGPEGMGKSTLLRDLQQGLAERGFEPVPLRLTQESRRFSGEMLHHLASTLAARHVVLLDGAEQMNAWAWWRFRRCVRRAGGMIITAHRRGLLPTVLECRTSPDLVLDIVTRLLGEDRTIDRDEVMRLHRFHGGNVREVLRELYDICGLQSDPIGAGKGPLDLGTAMVSSA